MPSRFAAKARQEKIPLSQWSRPTPNSTKAQAKRLAVMAQSGLSRAIYPVHTPLDGDVVFAAGMGAKPLPDPVFSLSELGMVAANVLARADRARYL